MQDPLRHTQSATSVIINPVAVEDFRSRVQGSVAETRIHGVIQAAAGAERDRASCGAGPE